MVNLVHIFYVIAFLLAWITAAVFITQASNALRSIRKGNDQLKAAYILTTTMAVIVWVSIGLALLFFLLALVGGSVIAFFFGAEIAAGVTGFLGIDAIVGASSVSAAAAAAGSTAIDIKLAQTAVKGASKGISLGVYLLLGAAALLLITTAVVSFTSMYYMAESGYDKSDSYYETAYTALLIAGLLSIVTLVLPLVIGLTLHFSRPAKAAVVVEPAT